MESTRTITVVCTVLELGPFKHFMGETGFSERICYLKSFNGGVCVWGGGTGGVWI